MKSLSTQIVINNNIYTSYQMKKLNQMIVSCVLEKPLGDNAEGTVIQLEDSVAQSLISAGIAREATEEDVAGAGAEDEDQGEDDQEDDGDAPALVEDQVRRLTADAEKTVTKAVEAVAEKLAARGKRPGINATNLHVKGSDYGETGGFANLGEFAKTVMERDKGDYPALTRLNRSKSAVLETMRSKATGMSIGGGSGHQGGDLVPQQWAQSIWRLSFENVPSLLDMCNQYPMENQIMNIPAWVQSSASAGLVAGVAAEAGTLTATVGVTANVQLSLNKFYVFVNTSDELERFNSYALDSVLKQVAPQRIRYLVNDSVVNGTNNGVNLVGNAATVTVTRATNSRISYPDILKMEAALFSDFVDDSVWLINNSTSPELYGMAFGSTSGTFPAFTPGTFGSEQLLGPKPVGLLLGKPVYRLENLPALGSKGDIVLYSPKSIAAGQTGLIADATPFLYFNLAQNSYRFMWYADTVNPLTSVYTRADNSTASNIVVLSAST